MAPLQNREDFVFRTIWNVSYYTVLAAATMVLYLQLSAYWTSDTDQLNATDLKMAILYWLPFVLSFLAACIFLAVLTYSARYNFAGVHADILITLFFNITFCWHKDPRLNLSNLVSVWCTNISSTRTVLVICNIISVFIVAAILCLLLPIALLGAVYSPAEDIRATATVIQASTVMLHLFFHLFCFDHYGYYSLIIVVVGICYIISGWIYVGLYSEWLQSTKATLLWNIIETLLVIQMLTIVFVVEYHHNVLYILSVIAFINYLLPNLPLLKIYLLHYFQQRIAVHRYYRYLIQGNSASVMDRMYCLLHESVHDIAHCVIEEEKITESTSLLLPVNSGNSSSRCVNSMQCFKVQYEYLSASQQTKKRILHRMHPRSKYEALLNFVAVIYAFSSLLAFLYPIWWFLYAWIYLSAYRQENVFVLGDPINAKSTFIWISSTLYFALSLCCIMNVCFDVFWTLGKQTCGNILRAISFVWSMKDWEYGDTQNAERLFQREHTIKAILDSKSLQMDTGLLIASYLY